MNAGAAALINALSGLMYHMYICLGTAGQLTSLILTDVSVNTIRDYVKTFEGLCKRAISH